MNEKSSSSVPAAMQREDRSDPSSPVVGYMCLIDFECELGAALGGNVIYPDIEDCMKHRPCTEHCGVVEVEVRARRIVREPREEDYSVADPT